MGVMVQGDALNGDNYVNDDKYDAHDRYIRIADVADGVGAEDVGVFHAGVAAMADVAAPAPRRIK